jgi:hypothetical protein
MGTSGAEFEVDGEAGMAGLEVKRAKKASMSVSWGVAWVVGGAKDAIWEMQVVLC